MPCFILFSTIPQQRAVGQIIHIQQESGSTWVLEITYPFNLFTSSCSDAGKGGKQEAHDLSAMSLNSGIRRKYISLARIWTISSSILTTLSSSVTASRIWIALILVYCWDVIMSIAPCRSDMRWIWAFCRQVSVCLSFGFLQMVQRLGSSNLWMPRCRQKTLGQQPATATATTSISVVLIDRSLIDLFPAD